MTNASFADIPTPWDAYLDAVEYAAGRPIADMHTIDMLYALYLGDVPAEQAAESVAGLQPASHAVARVLANLRPEDTMRVDLKPDPQTRFRGRAEAPQTALARRRTSISAEWRMVALGLAVAGAICLLISLVLQGRH